jgi:hypothetical protein
MRLIMYINRGGLPELDKHKRPVRDEDGYFIFPNKFKRGAKTIADKIKYAAITARKTARKEANSGVGLSPTVPNR